MKHLMFFGIAFAAIHISQSVEAFCDQPEDEGIGTSFMFALHYDSDKDQCSPFFYKGEGGNENRFTNERECMRNCSPNVENLYPFDAHVACHFKKAEGGCSGRYLRYYYDSHYDKCKKFIWTGCFGNGNRFTDMGTCNNTCAGIHDDGEDPEEIEPDTPYGLPSIIDSSPTVKNHWFAIIGGVLLAVILVAVITTVAVLTVNSKNKKSPKEGKAVKATKDKGEKKNKKEKREAQSETPLQDQSIEMA